MLFASDIIAEKLAGSEDFNLFSVIVNDMAKPERGRRPYVLFVDVKQVTPVVQEHLIERLNCSGLSCDLIYPASASNYELLWISMTTSEKTQDEIRKIVLDFFRDYAIPVDKPA